MPISLGLDSWALVMSAESGIWFDAIARSAEVFRLWQCRSRGGACSVLAFEEGSPLFGHKGTLPYSDYLVAFFPLWGNFILRGREAEIFRLSNWAVSVCVTGRPCRPRTAGERKNSEPGRERWLGRRHATAMPPHTPPLRHRQRHVQTLKSGCFGGSPLHSPVRHLCTRCKC
jgi:hypothetical protein